MSEGFQNLKFKTLAVTILQVYEPLVDLLMSVLLVMARLPLSGLVRETALRCLLDMLQLPYHMLHAHRHKVTGYNEVSCRGFV